MSSDTRPDPGTLTTGELAVDPALLAPGQIVQYEPPLVGFLRTWLQQSLVAHITGGMQIEGRLDSVNDDGTITVRDHGHRYEIAVSSIALIEVRG